MPTPDDMLAYLWKLAAKLDVGPLADRVLMYPGFTTWSGSIKERHHYGTGGLLRHTYEVVYLCQQQADTFEHTFGARKLDRRVLYLAALYHDVGKVRDYEPTSDDPRLVMWVATPHHRAIHHINRSAALWSVAVAETGLCRDIEDHVLHCILAHHGSPDRGSPVLPQTREAWTLHLMDAQSAWQDGCGRMDPKP